MKLKPNLIKQFENICKDHLNCDSLDDLRVLVIDDTGEIDFKNDSVNALKKIMHDIYKLGFFDGSNK